MAKAPALQSPLVLDDLAQRAMVDGDVVPARSPLNLYDFISDTNREALLDRGVIPWIADPGLAIRFLRPLPSVLVWLDYRLFHDGALGPHIVSFACWAAAVVAAYLLYFSLFGDFAALLGAAIFSLAPAHGIPLLWAANREVLLTVALSAVALREYVKWRNAPGPRNGLTCGLLFSAAILTGEYALSLMGYVAAFELVRADRFRRAMKAVLPAVIPIALYLVTRAFLGYGTRHSGLYRDPLHHPIGYLLGLPGRVSNVLSYTWGGDERSVGESTGLATLIGTACVCLLAILPIVVARRRPRGPLHGLGWLTAGFAFSLLPISATGPSTRVLGMAVLGTSGALGLLITSVVRLRRPKARRLLSMVDFGAVLVILYAYLWKFPSESREFIERALADENRSVAHFMALRPRVTSDTNVVVIRASTPSTVLSAPLMLRPHPPRHWWVLSQTTNLVTVVRTSANAIDVSSPDGALITIDPATIFRDSMLPLGEAVAIPGLRATVTRADAQGQPTTIHYEFEVDLSSPAVLWVAEGDNGYSEVAAPPIGFGVHIAP